MALPAREDILKRLRGTLDGYVDGTTVAPADPDDAIRPALDRLLTREGSTVRDGILVLLAMEVEHGRVIDWNEQKLYNPARWASRQLERVYAQLHISGSKEALQTGVKGVSRYIDRSNKTWQAVLLWASERRSDPEDVLPRVCASFNVSAEDICDPDAPVTGDLADARFVAAVAGGPDRVAAAPREALTHDDETLYEIGHGIRQDAVEANMFRQVCEAFEYLAAGIAATARNLPDMPALDTPRLVFTRVFGLLDDMLSQPSAGAHEQFIFAALLEGWLSQLDEQGVVETKNLNASDASAGTAADVQHKHRGQVMEAYEITAADYRSKVDQAKGTLGERDLRRIHIVSRAAARASGAELEAAVPADLDVSVLDVREECRSLVARLDKPHRRAALERLYVLLVEKQPNDSLVQSYVAALEARSLTQPRP